MYRTGHGRGRNPILLTGPVSTVADVCVALSGSVFGPERPAPRNLDGLADLLREARPARVIASDWRLPADDTRKVLAVFRDNRVELMR